MGCTVGKTNTKSNEKPVFIMPVPKFVIKTSRISTAEKFFINVCVSELMFAFPSILVSPIKLVCIYKEIYYFFHLNKMQFLKLFSDIIGYRQARANMPVRWCCNSSSCCSATAVEYTLPCDHKKGEQGIKFKVRVYIILNWVYSVLLNLILCY